MVSGQPTMSAIDTEILAMFNALNPTRQGRFLDLLAQLLKDQGKEHHEAQAPPAGGAK
jgi:hypothetical protein